MSMYICSYNTVHIYVKCKKIELRAVIKRVKGR